MNTTIHSIEPLKRKLLMRSQAYIGFNKEINKEVPKFNNGDNVRILKSKNIFAKGYFPNWSGEVALIKKVKNTVPWTYVINEKKLLECFTKKSYKNKSKRV